MDIARALMFVSAALSALLVGYGSVLFTLGQCSRRWPAVPGVIESSMRKTSGITGLRAYWVEVRYAWHSDGARRGAWIGFACPGTASNPKFAISVAATLQAELVPGARVDVFVCPRLPSLAVLRIGPNLAALGYVGLGLFLAGMSLWMA